MAKPKWETVVDESQAKGENLQRLRVEQGWLYKATFYIKGRTSVSLAFVPDSPSIFAGMEDLLARANHPMPPAGHA